jgi:large subunit ribosomal protein L1
MTEARDVYGQRVHHAVLAGQEGKKARFVESVEVAMRLGIDPRRGDQMVRGVTSLPHGTGKEAKVAIFTGQDLDLASASGIPPC